MILILSASPPSPLSFPSPLTFLSILQNNPPSPTSAFQALRSQEALDYRFPLIPPKKVPHKKGYGKYAIRDREMRLLAGLPVDPPGDESMDVDGEARPQEEQVNEPRSSTPIQGMSTRRGRASLANQDTDQSMNEAEVSSGLIVGGNGVEGEGKVLRERKRKERWTPDDSVQEAEISRASTSRINAASESPRGRGKRSVNLDGTSPRNSSIPSYSLSRTYSKRERRVSSMAPPPVPSSIPAIKRGPYNTKGKAKASESSPPATLDAKGKEPRSAGLILAPPGFKMVALPQTETQVKGHKAKKWVMIRDDEELPDVRPEDIDLTGSLSSTLVGKGKGKQRKPLLSFLSRASSSRFQELTPCSRFGFSCP